MIKPLDIINKYYSDSEELRHILISHSANVAELAVSIVDRHPELSADRAFVYEASMLHDIGIIKTKAPSIYCFGTYPYIAHGYLGADLLRKEGLDRHALVCERHTGVGLSEVAIKVQNLPLPTRNMEPVSIEEQIVCFADNFFSKTHLNEQKSIDSIKRRLSKFGEEGVHKFDRWCALFL